MLSSFTAGARGTSSGGAGSLDRRTSCSQPDVEDRRGGRRDRKRGGRDAELSHRIASYLHRRKDVEGQGRGDSSEEMGVRVVCRGGR